MLKKNHQHKFLKSLVLSFSKNKEMTEIYTNIINSQQKTKRRRYVYYTTINVKQN